MGENLDSLPRQGRDPRPLGVVMHDMEFNLRAELEEDLCDNDILHEKLGKRARQAAEKARKEEEEREAAEQARKEEKEREAAEQARKEEEEREAAEQARKEEKEREAAEQARKEEEERE